MRLYNHPDRSEIELDLSSSKPIKIYTCGPTVYDFPHVGNWYTFVRYDLLIRTLRSLGYQVEWVMNITDVGHLVSDADEGEDKLEKGAKREGKTAQEIAKFYGEYFKQGLKRLNFSPVTHLPKATDYIAEQIELIQLLETKGYTYNISDGVYFDTSKFTEYAEFAHLNLSEQEEGARVEINAEKRSAGDFAVWKLSPKNEKRDMEWDSPWGVGFPGWHLECSAMIHAILGEPIDIHAGGTDHIPVHHTNEVAQSKAAFNTDLSRYWMHCNHILVDGKKMSKSLGNFYTLEDIEAKGISLDVFRLHVLSGHYRSQSEFSWEALESSRARLQNWVDLACLRQQLSDIYRGGETSLLEIWQADLLEIAADDLDTPSILSLIDKAASSYTVISNDELKVMTLFIEQIDELLGTQLMKLSEDIPDNLKDLITEREKVRKSKDWSASDKIRDILTHKGIAIRDTEHGALWSRLV